MLSENQLIIFIYTCVQLTLIPFKICRMMIILNLCVHMMKLYRIYYSQDQTLYYVNLFMILLMKPQ